MSDRERFDIPVVVFIFKRLDTLEKIFARLAEIRPKKLYLIADQGRDDAERSAAAEVREGVEAFITWDCEVVRDYAKENRGVYGNIALGAKKVFEQEPMAIFLEDDNLPSASFFPFCEEMLNRYKDSSEVLWICGTNYLSQYDAADGASYVFTRQLMPCGWASWADKFLGSYDFELEKVGVGDKTRARSTYSIHRLYPQQLFNVEYEKAHRERTGRFYSWDYHMAWTLRTGGYYGIAPCVNLIENIGVDECSEHGGTDLALDMTNRLCSMAGYELSFPLRHPDTVEVDGNYEKLIERKLLYPMKDYCGVLVKLAARRLFGFPPDLSLRQAIRRTSK